MPATTLLAELRYRARANPGAAALQSLFLRYKWGLESECPIDHVYVMIVTQWNLQYIYIRNNDNVGCILNHIFNDPSDIVIGV